jgi:hypothetical protein
MNISKVTPETRYSTILSFCFLMFWGNGFGAVNSVDIFILLEETDVEFCVGETITVNFFSYENNPINSSYKLFLGDQLLQNFSQINIPNSYEIELENSSCGSVTSTNFIDAFEVKVLLDTAGFVVDSSMISPIYVSAFPEISIDFTPSFDEYCVGTPIQVSSSIISEGVIVSQECVSQMMPEDWNISTANGEEDWDILEGDTDNASSFLIAFQTPGTYTIEMQVMTPICGSLSTTITVDINPKPLLNLNLEDTYCEGDMQDTLIGFPAGGFFLGDPYIVDSTLGIFNPFEATPEPVEISYVYSNLGCIDTITEATIILPAPENVDFTGLDQEYCKNDPSTTLLASVGPGSFSSTEEDIIIPLNDSIALFTPTFSGMDIPITYTYTNKLGCSADVTKYVTIHELPLIQFSPSPLVITLGDPVELSCGLDEDNYTLLWGNQETTSTIFVATPGLYILAATDLATGCVSVDSIFANTPNATANLAVLDTRFMMAFPNPTRNTLSLKLDIDQNSSLWNKPETLYIFDFQSKSMVYKSQVVLKPRLDIDISKLASGTYCALIKNYIVTFLKV